MKVTDSNVIRFHLQILHGITVRSFDRKKDRLLVSGSKVFGVPLENLLRQYIPEFGLVPWWVREIMKFTQNSISEVNLVCFYMLFLSFLVDACSFLLERAGTVGLFRKPGSLPRIKNLRASCRFQK